MKSNPSTGYSWYVLNNATSHLTIKSNYLMLPEGSPQAVGAPGFDVFQVTPTAKGEQVLEFAYYRPWLYRAEHEGLKWTAEQKEAFNASNDYRTVTFIITENTNN